MAPVGIPPPPLPCAGADGGFVTATVDWGLSAIPAYPFRSVPGGSPLMKVCIGGGDGAGRGAGAGVAVGWLPPPADPLLLLTISPFQFVHARLLIAQYPPPLSDHLHWGGRWHRAAGRCALSGDPVGLRLVRG